MILLVNYCCLKGDKPPSELVLIISKAVPGCVTIPLWPRRKSCTFQIKLSELICFRIMQGVYQLTVHSRWDNPFLFVRLCHHSPIYLMLYAHLDIGWQYDSTYDNITLYTADTFPHFYLTGGRLYIYKTRMNTKGDPKYLYISYKMHYFSISFNALFLILFDVSKSYWYQV